jgi:hypothetical protein
MLVPEAHNIVGDAREGALSLELRYNDAASNIQLYQPTNPYTPNPNALHTRLNLTSL